MSSNMQNSFDFDVQENTMTQRMDYDNKPKNNFKVGGLFAGIGGIEFGFKKQVLRFHGQMRLIKMPQLPIE